MSHALAPLLERGAESLRKLPNLEDVIDAADALSLIVGMYLPEPGPPLDPRYKSTTECLKLLKREPELHEILKLAHAEESYDLVRASGMFIHLAVSSTNVLPSSDS